MTDSYGVALIEGLRLTLENKFLDVGIDMEWGNYGIIDPIANNQFGRIFLKVTPLLDRFISSQFYSRDYEITLDAIATSIDSQEAYYRAINLCEYLLEILIQEIRILGINGEFRGVSLHNALFGLELVRTPSIGYMQKQGGLELVQVQIPFSWKKEA